MPIDYLTIDEVVWLHAKAAEVSGDGPFALVKQGILESVLTQIQNDDYYPTLEAKVTHVFHSPCCIHCFVNGNKRAALAASAQMLLKNGHIFRVAPFLRAMENVVVHVAAGRIGKPLLHDIIIAYVTDVDDEEVKLRILEAITPDEEDQNA